MSKFRISMNGKVYEMEIEQIDDGFAAEKTADQVPKAGVPETLTPATKPTPKAQPKLAGNASVTSPMPGTILRVLVTEGQSVVFGETVLVLEAMKMENEIQAPRSGRIVGLSVVEGQTVANSELLFSVE